MRRTRTTGRPIALPKMGLLLLILAVAIIFLPRTKAFKTWMSPNPAAPVAPDGEFVDSDLVVDAPSEDLDKEKSDQAGTDQPENLDVSRKPDSTMAALEDPQLRDWLSLIKDNTLSIHKREMPAYWRLLSMADKSSFDDLYAASRKSPSFNDFHQLAAKHRGELVSMEINIRRVLRYDANEGNAAGLKQLYEIWGWTNQSKSWLYVIVTPDLPEGMTEGNLVDQKATFAGYFFKLQGYQSAMNKPTDRPYVAPLMIGRFHVIPSEKKVAGVNNVWPYVLAGGFAIAGVIALTVWKSWRRPGLRRKYSSDETPTQPTETSFDWLEKNVAASDETKP
jgi:hypothetical protein